MTMLFVGQLPDSSFYLGAVGFSQTFVTVTGIAISCGFTTALFTLIPQSIGAGHAKHAAVHIQRSFYITTIVCVMMSVVQFFAGDIMIAIGQPPELKPIITTYCRVPIPYSFSMAFNSILKRLLQSLDMNVPLTYCTLTQLASAAPLLWFFMFYMDFGYWGAAIALNLVTLITTVAAIILIIHKGYGFVVLHFIALAIPGLFQYAFESMFREVAVILAGYVA